MAEETKDFKHIVRIANTDLDGNKPIAHALRKIKGVGFGFASAICSVTSVQKEKKTGVLSEQEIKKLDSAIRDPASVKIPLWMLNRRKDYETGEDKHIITGNLDFVKDNDIKRLKKIKSNRGMRHAWRLPLRGQRTRSNFRKNKGKGSLGVKKKSGKAGRV